MRIRPEQLRQMKSVRDADFCARLCAELRAALPEQTTHLSEPVLSKLVSDALDKAQRYQFASGDAVRRFIKLAVLISPQFDEVPEVQRFLMMPDLDPDVKIKLLSELTAQHLRAKVS